MAEITRFLVAMRDRWTVFIVVFSTTFGLGFLAVSNLPKSYISEAKLIFVPGDEISSTGQALAGFSDLKWASLIRELGLSHVAASKIATDYGLEDPDDIKADLTIDLETARQNAIRLKISFTGPDPELAQGFVKQVADELIKIDQARRLEIAGKRKDLFSLDVENKDAQLNSISNEIELFERKNPRLEPTRRKGLVSELQSYDRAIDQIEREVRLVNDLQSRRASTQARPETLDEGYLSAQSVYLSRQLGRLKAERSELEMLLDNARAAEHQLRLLQGEFEKTNAEAKRALMEFSRADSIFNALSIGNGPRLVFLDQASLPESPTGPPHLLLLLGALSLAFFVGMSSVGIIEFVRQPVRNETDIEKILGIRPLGVIPELKPNNHLLRFNKAIEQV